MNLTLRLFLIACVVLYFVVIFVLLKRERLTLKYTLLWLFFGLVMVFILAFPAGLEPIIHTFGIVELTNGIFAIGIFAILLICMALTSIVSTMNEKVRRLAQLNALHEKRIRELENHVRANKQDDASQ